MGNENGTWIMRGLPADDPRCLHSWQECEAAIETVGFLPLFRNDIPGFSVEEMTEPHYWWTEDPRDPWEWRKAIAAGGRTAYGKFFGGRAGFVSRDFFPVFANWRRDGYDFDARWDDGKASIRCKKLMDAMGDGSGRFSYELKDLAGFGPGGEKNFEGTLTALQMQTYLVVRDFRQRINKKGLPYGWSIAVLATPEALWGQEAVTSCYRMDPEECRQQIVDRIGVLFGASDEAVRKVLG